MGRSRRGIEAVHGSIAGCAGCVQNIKLEFAQEVDQLKAQLLAILAGGPSTGTRAPSEPKLSKIFSDPGNFEEW